MNRRYRSVLAMLVFVTSLAGSQFSMAQSHPEEQQTLKEQIALLQRRLQQLERRVDAALPATSGTTVSTDRIEALDKKVQLLESKREDAQGNANALVETTQAATVSAGQNGFIITNADKSYRLRIGGHLQVDGKTFYDDEAHLVPDSFNIRRLRPIFEGNVGKYVDFRFMPDFGNGTTVLYDAYADLTYRPYAALRGGKFKTPMGLEQLQNDADLTFVERSLATDLVPNRDEGFALFGDVASRLNYTVAALNGAPDGANIDGTTHNGKDVVGRLFATPWAQDGPTALKGLGFGAAVSSGRQDEGASLPTFKTVGGQVAFFTYASTAAAGGRRLNYSPQLYYYNGPFGVLAEYVTSEQKILGTTGKTTAAREISDHAWEVTGSWLLTGERKTFGRLTPRRNFEAGNGKGFGAWEIAGRYSQLDADPTVFRVGFADPTKSAQSAREWAVGLNWYLNRNVKLVSNYDQTEFQRGAVLGNRLTEKGFLNRLQIAF